MSHFEYRMVPLEDAPAKDDALEGLPEGAVRAMTEHANALSRAGWEYVRTDTVTTSRKGFWRTVENRTSVLVFRRKFRVEPMPGLDRETMGLPKPRRVEPVKFTGPKLAYSQTPTLN